MKQVRKFKRIEERILNYLEENNTTFEEEHERILNKESKLPSKLRAWLPILMVSKKSEEAKEVKEEAEEVVEEVKELVNEVGPTGINGGDTHNGPGTFGQTSPHMGSTSGLAWEPVKKGFKK